MTNLNILKGVDYAMQWPVLDDAGEPADVTGWDLWGQVRASTSSATVLHEWSVAAGNVELGDGFVRIIVPYADSEAWDWTHGRYDVILTSPDDARSYIGGGSVKVTPIVTHADEEV